MKVRTDATRVKKGEAVRGPRSPSKALRFRDLLQQRRHEEQPDPELTSSPLVRTRPLEPHETLGEFESLRDSRRTSEFLQSEAGATFAADGSIEDRSPSEHVLIGEPLNPTTQSAPRAAESKPPTPARSGEVEQLMSQLVEKVQAGEDARRRKTVILQLDAGHDGTVTVRLRRQGDGFELRMRPTDPVFARRLHEQQNELRHEAAKRGLRFTQIDVVR